MDWIKTLEPLKFYISAHNTQPFKMEIHGHRFDIFVDEKRRLPVGDPHNRDLMMSLGAFLSALDVVLAARGFKAASSKIGPSVDQKPLASIQVESAKDLMASAESRLQLMRSRFSYRGGFKKSKPAIIGESSFQKFGMYASAAPEVKAKIADLYDQTNLKTLARKDYLTELYSWMRFSKSHPRWKEDGLNAEGIHLSGVEAIGASVILKPSVFGILNKMGLGGAMISEKPQITSAQYIVAFAAPQGASFVEQGRLFFEQWLNLTELGLYGAPLSLLTEQESTSTPVKQLLNIPQEKILVNLLRCGALPEKYQHYAPARLEVNQFVQQRS